MELRRRDDVVVERPQRRVAEALVEVPDLGLGQGQADQVQTVSLERPRGRPGVAAMRRLLNELDPVNPARSTFPLEWGGRTYRFDFCFERSRTILETNGRRWHDDAADYESDNDKWSVTGRHGYRIVLATWAKIVRHPDEFLGELTTSMTQAA